MRTLSHESLLMTTSTHSASWSVDINRPFAECCASLPGPTLTWPTISPRKHLFALTKTSAASGAKHVFPLGSIGSSLPNCFREDARRRKELVGINEDQWQAEMDPQTVDPGLRHDLMHALSLLPLHERFGHSPLLPERTCRTMKQPGVLQIPLGTVKDNMCCADARN